jgi:hypothetical protein
MKKGWGYSSIVEHLPSMQEALAFIPNPEKKRKRRGGEGREGEERRKGGREGGRKESSQVYI